MPLPSFYLSADGGRDWSVPRAVAYGAGIGAAAAAFKTLGPLGGTSAPILEIIAAAVAFALLCGAAAVLRNFVAHRFIHPDAR